jgi:hypothetical protein
VFLILVSKLSIFSSGQSLCDLRDTLEAARLQAIQELAPADGTIPSVSNEALQRVAFIQIALVAVREELAVHAVHVGGGSEQPLD